MIIQLQEPFASRWSKGYLVINNQNRRNIILFNNDVDRTTISYARYLMGIKLGYFVPDHLEVDHKDDDKTNDDISNLKLLTGEQNRLKEQYRQAMERTFYGFHCAYCNTPFVLSGRDLNMRIAKGTELAFCTRICAGKYNSEIGNGPPHVSISYEKTQQIKQLRSQGLSSYKIAEITGAARNTVMKYW
jgi:hypothetical protein